MPDLIDPNQTLAKQIALALTANGLILEKNADDLAKFLAEGKIKDTTWKKAFENKIATLTAGDEA
jgi:hypothetical protein